MIYFLDLAHTELYPRNTSLITIITKRTDASLFNIVSAIWTTYREFEIFHEITIIWSNKYNHSSQISRDQSLWFTGKKNRTDHEILVLIRFYLKLFNILMWFYHHTVGIIPDGRILKYEKCWIDPVMNNPRDLNCHKRPVLCYNIRMSHRIVFYKLIEPTQLLVHQMNKIKTCIQN